MEPLLLGVIYITLFGGGTTAMVQLYNYMNL